MGRRTLLLIGALVLAALGTFLVWLYAHNADTAARQGQQLKTVLVAKSNVAVGTTGSAAAASGAFEQTQVASEAVVPGAISDTAPIADLVALVPIYPGQQIISQQWGAQAQTGGLPIPVGQVAVSVSLGDPQRVAGFVSPGSTVAIFTMGSQGGVAGAAATPTVKTLLSNVTVLAVGPTTATSGATGGSGTSTSNSEQIPSAILTLALTQDQAQKVIYASGQTPGASFNSLYFALMNKDSKVDPANAGVTSKNLFP